MNSFWSQYFLLILLCKECDHRLWVAPFIFIFLRSPFYYFAIPILWASPYFYDFYFQADMVWRQSADRWLLDDAHVCGGHCFLTLYLVESASSSEGSACRLRLRCKPLSNFFTSSSNPSEIVDGEAGDGED